jgi:thiol-disulfide isomerase/thioredoxin
MNKRYNFFYTISLIFAICVVTLSVQAQNKPVAITLKIGDQAPIIKTNNWIKGNPVTTIDKGKIYVVEFWATWCAPCIAGMPHLSELAEKYKDKITVCGISIMERGQNPLPKVKRFVDSVGNKMSYNVAADDNNFMRDNWLKASGEGGIPCAYIVDKSGRIAWIGLPAKMDNVLPKILNNSWNIDQERANREEAKRLAIIDGGLIPKLNTFMGNPGDPEGALVEIDKILYENPKLKYYPNVGHFTFCSLLKTNPDKAVTFAKEWFAANETPSWQTVTNAIYRPLLENKDLPKAIYELAADCYQAQLDNYPWSMKPTDTYLSIAQLQFKAKNKVKAIEAMQKAIDEAKKNPSFPATDLAKMNEDLKKYQSM